MHMMLRENNLKQRKIALQNELEKVKQAKSEEVKKVVQNLEHYVLEQNQCLAWIDGTLEHTAGTYQLDKFENDLFPKLCPSESSNGLVENVIKFQEVDLAFRESKLDRTPLLGMLKSNTSYQSQAKASPSEETCPKSLDFSVFHSQHLKCDENVMIEELANSIQSFCIVADYIWLVTISSQIIIFSTAGYLVDRRKVSHIISPKTIICISAKRLAIAASSGIHTLGVEDKTPRKITDLTFHSICYQNSKLFAFDHTDRKVFVFTSDTSHVRWRIDNTIQMRGGYQKEQAQQDTNSGVR